MRPGLAPKPGNSITGCGRHAWCRSTATVRARPASAPNSASRNFSGGPLTPAGRGWRASAVRRAISRLALIAMPRKLKNISIQFG
jgi:hypothetical protein